MTSINRVDSQESRMNGLDETTTNDQLTISIKSRLAKMKEQQEELDHIAHSYGKFRPSSHIYEQIEKIRKIKQVARETLDKKENTKTLGKIDQDLHRMIHLNEVFLKKLEQAKNDPPPPNELLFKKLLNPLTSAENKKTFAR